MREGIRMEEKSNSIDFITKIEEEKRLEEARKNFELKLQHKKVKQILKGGKTFNKKRIRERNQLLEIMKGYSELKKDM